MRRAVIIAAWIAGTTLPLLVATVFAFGCCALPFHGVVHKLMPLCDFVLSAVQGGDHDDAVPPAKQEPVKRITAVAPSAFRLASLAAQRLDPITPATSYRDFISHGATRCDRDVGLHVLVETFRI